MTIIITSVDVIKKRMSR